MSANRTKYILTIAGAGSENFQVTSFAGEDAIGLPYRFDIEFSMSDAGKACKAAPPDAGVIGKDCRFEIEQNGETVPYCGIAAEFRACDSEDTRYTIRLVPRLYLLTLNVTSRVFQNTTVPDIIKAVVEKAGLKEDFRSELEPDGIKYPRREFCVQHRETDLAFISRLMEESGIWYYIDRVKRPDGTRKECAVVTDKFSSYPKLGRSIPFKKGSGFAEITTAGSIVESISHISARAALMPESVRVRAYNHRIPESPPDAICPVRDGHRGSVYEYGGAIGSMSEAEYRAELYIRRLWVERFGIEGKGNSASFRAGLRVPISHAGNLSMSGDYLLTAVRHVGGWQDGAYTYRNEFSGVRAEPEIYAPPLRTPVPHIDGVTTASVGATGDHHPTLNEYGNYNVSMPYILKEKQSGSGQNSIDYGKSKHIRLAQPSGGMCGDKPYCIHFPSKRGAEMVMAYIEGNPDRPLGLGFVPNGSSPSVVNNLNTTENVIRSWGGSELVMTDTEGNKSVKLSTPGVRYLELHDGNKAVRVKSEHCEIQLNDEKQYAEIDAGGHTIHINYKEDESVISITTVKEHLINISDKNDEITVKTASGNVIKMNDPDDVITVQNINDENKIVLNGKDNRITVESADSKGVFDGSGNKIIMENKDNKVIIDGGDDSVTLDAKKDINLKAGGKVVIDAKEGVSNKGQTIKLNK